MTATEELRRLLDERGADYRVSSTGYSIDIGPYTTAYANRSDTTLDVSLRQVTPAQAVTATLGDADLAAENAKLRERITTQKQTIQAYRDESREWREVAERAQAENAKLRELAADMLAFLDGADCARFPAGDVVITQAQVCNFYDRARELGVEVDA